MEKHSYTNREAKKQQQWNAIQTKVITQCFNFAARFSTAEYNTTINFWVFCQYHGKLLCGWTSTWFQDTLNKAKTHE